MPPAATGPVIPMRPNDKGFTLLEILVTLAILSILTAASYLIAIPTLQRQHNKQICQSIDAWLHHAQQQAWQQHRIVAIQYQPPQLQALQFNNQHWQTLHTPTVTIPASLQLILQSDNSIDHTPSILIAPNLINNNFTLTLKNTKQNLCQWHSSEGSMVKDGSIP